jgi:tetratricopeptide (TPR) repeat protein
MKPIHIFVVAALLATAGMCPRIAGADDNVITIDPDSVLAIAFSESTGEFHYVYNYEDHEVAERAVLSLFQAKDAKLLRWVNWGFCALALGDTKGAWGIGWKVAPEANNTEAEGYALANCADRTSGAHIAVCLSSDGQFLKLPQAQPIAIGGVPEGVDHMNRGNDWSGQGQYDNAIAEYTEALRLFHPDDAKNRAIVCFNRGLAWDRKGDSDKAIADFSQAVTVYPKYAKCYSCRGHIWSLRGNLDKAIADYNQALAISPDDPITHNYRGIAWLHRRECDKAIADFSRAMAINPKYTAPCCNRGNAWKIKGDFGKAIADYDLTLAIDPQDAITCGNLAVVLATCSDEKFRDGKRAFENANMAYQLDGGKHWRYIDILAEAYAEVGDFEKAKEWEAKAIELVNNDKSANAGDKLELLARQELFKQGKPYHEQPKKKK